MKQHHRHRTAEGCVVIRNIYYLMAYAFDAVDFDRVASLGEEPFEHFEDLLAAIIVVGVDRQVRRGFEREYVMTEGDLSYVKGHLNPRETAMNLANGRLKANCTLPSYTVDTYMNRILVTVMHYLLKCDGVDDRRKLGLKRCLLLLRDAEPLNPNRIVWSRLTYSRLNADYKLLMNVCKMVVTSMIYDPTARNLTLGSFLPGRTLDRLFEEFLLGYYKRVHGDLRPKARTVDRHANDKLDFLPSLITDVALESEERVFILEAKCYGQILKKRFKKKRLAPSHLNQLLSYVVHDSYEREKPVEGMLLYAGTRDESPLDLCWQEAGYTLRCRTLDLGASFSEISDSLNEIAGLAKAPLCFEYESFPSQSPH